MGSASVASIAGDRADEEVRWPYLRRASMGSTRDKGRPRQFYPIHIDPGGAGFPRVAKIGEPIARDVDRHGIPDEPGLVTIWPVNPDGVEMTWGMVPATLQRALDEGFARVTAGTAVNAPYVIAYLTIDAQEKVATGEYEVTGTRPDGSKIVTIPGGRTSRPTTVWRATAHDAGAYGTGLLRSLTPGRRFPFPKSVYAVEDAIRYIVADKPTALVLDFFAGSGTTAHAVARLNKQDGGRRQSIMVTNNEVSADEARALRARALRPGDPEWEALGIFEHITRPRVTAAITGLTPDGPPIKGDYKFTDEFSMADGFEENIAFLELRYLDADDVDLGLAYDDLAPLLWLRAGAQGRIARCINDDGARLAFDWTDRYGVLFDEDQWRAFVAARPERATAAFIATWSPATFAGIAAELPTGMDVVRLYDTYLSQFLPERVGS
jgi:adenine-specific DNA-methyltransferase